MITIRPAKPSDARRITEIYNHYITNTVISFEFEPVSTDEMSSRIKTITTRYPFYVAEEADQLVGYAYATKWKTRQGYHDTVESSVYLDPAFTGKGIGSLLYRHLLAQLKLDGILCVIGGIALPNPVSIRLHESFGFKKIGEFKDVGIKFNKPVTVGYWQLHF